MLRDLWTVSLLLIGFAVGVGATVIKHGDAVQHLNAHTPHPDIDLIVTSPPYNLDVSYELAGLAPDNQSWWEYCSFSRAWLAAAWFASKPDGRLCLNVPLDTNKGGKRSFAACLTTIAQQAGWQYQTTIIWNESNISRRTAWGSWASPSAPFVTAPVEVVLVLYKEVWPHRRFGVIPDITPAEFLEWTLGLWTFPGESAKRVGHPAPYPEELVRRLIKLYSYPDDLIVDPFVGSGTTALVATLLGRRFEGYDLSPEYVQLAEQRVRACRNAVPI